MSPFEKSENQKFTPDFSATAPPLPPYGAAPAIGIPVSSVNQTYSYTTPIVPAPPRPRPQAQVPWSTGLCDCSDDLNSCCTTCCCPCITFGRISEIIDKGSSSCGANGAIYALIMYFTACQCLYSCSYRSKLRAQYNLEEGPCADCLVHCCCEPCALCQEYRELQNYGFNMSLGWHGNVENQNRLVTIAPMQPSMTR
ncbi:hypothetical protein NE237_019898 [Protea cynaroides]|uniref:Uncharacterized protein n=1 Tax=Protea cynaroides TaxID=273540 RepID=A0A9Q0K3D4_9MAGN|nr:hypothetical protein NE237_019898 [Protea cynaroides]